MGCPACGNEGTYVGFNTIECPNPDCRHYSWKAAWLARADGSLFGCYDAYSIWERHWKDVHPDDDELDILELIELYGKDPEVEALSRSTR